MTCRRVKRYPYPILHPCFSGWQCNRRTDIDLKEHGMTILITLKHAQLIKKELGLNLPHVKSAHRAEAMARGLGWKSNAALRAALMCGDAECEVNDDAFIGYLTDKGFEGVTGCRLSVVVETAIGVGTLTEDETPADSLIIKTVRPSAQAAISSRWSTLAFGLFAVVCYLLLTVQTADEYLEQAVARSLDVAETAGTRSVLILDADLSQEVVSGLMEYPYISSAEILDDHGSQLAAGQRTIQPETFSERLQALVALDQEIEYSRILQLPPTMNEKGGLLRVTVNRPKALSLIPGPTWGGMIFSLLLGVGLLALLIAGQSALRGWMRLYLDQHYRLAHN
ncbi:hypothetical protein ACFO5Q_11100 [Kordiimonas lipolytica]|uniref:Uncharacterized protein n=1 Tax=Kordiimonas lipolytica TaxID=1662421 RepID=A0ABV8UB95_9PROT|nr:hypothetical protein [Kordiimonas lipolytica]